jgi:hypothetical protein
MVLRKLLKKLPDDYIVFENVYIEPQGAALDFLVIHPSGIYPIKRISWNNSTIWTAPRTHKQELFSAHAQWMNSLLQKTGVAMEGISVPLIVRVDRSYMAVNDTTHYTELGKNILLKFFQNRPSRRVSDEQLQKIIIFMQALPKD